MKKNVHREDHHTKQYIKKIRILQLVIMCLIAAAFIIFSHTIIRENKENLEAVVLAEVEESMKETVNNITVHIESERERIEKDARIAITDLEKRMISGGVDGIEDVLTYLEVSEENQLGQAIEIVYTPYMEKSHYINRYERKVLGINGKKTLLYRDAAIYEGFSLDGQEIILFIRQEEIDKIVKKEIHDYLHEETYEGNQYVWVNEVLDMDGGPYYAIRRIHPNLIESEGEYLSTYSTDIKGNYPYKTELEGIRRKGEVFHSYYFKNKVNDEVMEKFSYAQYYEPFHWIIATGETIEEVYAYSKVVNSNHVSKISMLLVIFIALFGVASEIMVKILEHQAQDYRKNLLKQAEVFEDIYTTLSMGLMRIRMSEDKTSIIKINPKGLELLNIPSEEECTKKIKGHILDTMVSEDAEKLVEASQTLKKQWESAVVECHIKCADHTLRLLRIRDTLVDFDGDAKIIQRMCQDITEERRQHEKALMEAEEKATLDPMTQIKNKKAIEQIIRSQIIEAGEQNQPIAIGFVDIDNFRDYNTKYGHMQGDEVIKYVASTIKEWIPGIVGRNGGDEFAFCIPNASYEQVEAAMQIIHKQLNEGIIIRETGEKVPTPCSIGVVIEQKKELQFDYVMEQSDAAMYEAKARGKNTYHILNNV